MIQILFLMFSFVFFIINFIAVHAVALAYLIPDVESPMFSLFDVIWMTCVSGLLFVFFWMPRRSPNEHSGG